MRREAAIGPEAASTIRMVDALAGQATRVRRQASQLAETFDTIDAPFDRASGGPKAPTPVADAAHVMSGATHGRAAPDPAQTLTQEMKLAGTGRDQAKDYLKDSFGLSNADELIERVYGLVPAGSDD